MKQLLLAVIMPAAAFGADYTIDTTHSSVQFSVRHMMVSNVRGEFAKVTGAVSYDPNDIAATKIEATIDAATINTREPKRDAHLKSADFFDVAKFPTMTFQSAKASRGACGGLTVTGNLTLHGVTKEVAFKVDGPTPEIKDQRGGARMGATATARINRKDFGLTWNRALEAGGVVVGEDVDITIDVELIRK